MIPKGELYKFVADGGIRDAARRRRRPHATRPERFDAVRRAQDVVQKTSFADGEVKVGDAVKNSEAAKVRIMPGHCF
jgi:hypothetical protein